MICNENSMSQSVGIMCHSYHEEVLILLFEMYSSYSNEVTVFLSENVYVNTRTYWHSRLDLSSIYILSDNQQIFYEDAFKHAAVLAVDEMIGTEVPTCPHFRKDYDGALSWVLHELKFDFGLEWVPPWRRRKRTRQALHKSYVDNGDRYFVLTDEMRSFAQQHTEKHVDVIPIRSMAKNNVIIDNKSYIITITGRVMECKDYELAIACILELRLMKIDVKLVLLGCLGNAPYPSKIKKLADEANEHCPGVVEYFQEYIEDHVFGVAVGKTDILLAPLRQNNNLFRRFFSTTNLIDYHISNHITGSYEESVRYKKPVLYPAWFYDPYPAPSGTYLYRGKRQLIKILADCASKKYTMGIQ